MKKSQILRGRRVKIGQFFKKEFLNFCYAPFDDRNKFKMFFWQNFLYIAKLLFLSGGAYQPFKSVNNSYVYELWYIYTLYTVWGLNVHSIYKVCITFQRENYWMFSTRQPVTGSLKVLNVNTMIRIQKLSEQAKVQKKLKWQVLTFVTSIAKGLKMVPIEKHAISWSIRDLSALHVPHCTGLEVGLPRHGMVSWSDRLLLPHGTGLEVGLPKHHVVVYGSADVLLFIHRVG